MNRALAGTALAALLGIAGWQAAEALQNESAPDPVSTEAPAETSTEPAEAGVTDVATPAAPRERPALKGETPMAERVAVIGLLNKRNGLWRDLTMKPGQALRADDVIVRLRACETTAPWEQQAFTGAFVQVDVEGVDQRWRRIFSGWLYKESPSLNVVEHPVYDVWVKSCTMTHPDIGADTVAMSSGAARPPSASSAPKSTASPTPTPTPSPVASASPSNPT